MKQLIYLLLGIVFLELILRLFWFPPFLRYKRDDFAWVSKNVSLNRFGYRDREFEINKPKNTFRIYSLGDSYTYGWYINNYLDSYPKILESNLKEKFPDKNIEVVNASRAGFSLKDSLDRFKNEGYLFSPDIVTIGINIQDIASKEFSPKFVKNKFIRNLRIYQATFGNIERRRVGNLTYNEVIETYKEGSKQLENASLLLTDLKNETKKLNSEIIIVIFPQYNPADPNGEYRYYFYHKAVKKLLDSLSIKYIDLYEAFNDVNDKTELVINPVDPHPSIKANKIVGNKLSEIIKPINLNLGSKFLDLTPPKVLFNRKFNLNTQKLFLPNTGDRKLNYLEDKLLTAKYQTHGGWPGAKLEYNYPGNNSKLTFSQNLYGFNVVGVSKIQVFWRDNGAQQSLDIPIENALIRKVDGLISVDVKRKGEDDYYKLTLDLEVNQLDYEDDKVVSEFRTDFITKDSLSQALSFANYGWLNDRQVLLGDNPDVLIPAAIKIK